MQLQRGLEEGRGPGPPGTTVHFDIVKITGDPKCIAHDIAP